MAEAVSRRTSDTSAGSTMCHSLMTLNAIAKVKALFKKKSTVTPADNTPPPTATATALKAVMPTSHNQGSMTNRPELTSVVKLAYITIDEDKLLTLKDLEYLSNNFSSHNELGRTQFGVLYKGLIPNGWKRGMRSGEVTIKMWKYVEFIHEGTIFPQQPSHVRHRMAQEVNFLQLPHIVSHPYTVQVMGYCLEDNNLGVVYDLKPFDTLKVCIHREDFGWLNRVNVAVKLACVLKFFHEHLPEYIVRNLSPAHVMLDQDLNPFLIDYAMLRGGSFFEMKQRQYGGPCGSMGYVSMNELQCCETTKRNDVHGYGAILLEMMRKTTYEKRSLWIDEAAWEDYISHLKKMEKGEPVDSEYSFVHESLRNDPDYDAGDGNKMSILGLRCVEKLEETPRALSMGDSMDELKELEIVRCHPELLDGVAY